MLIDALGYVGVGSSRLDDWAAWGTGFLGMQLQERATTALSFRMDDHRQRFVVQQGADNDAPFYGFEVTDDIALDLVAGRLEQAGVQVTRAAPALIQQRCVTDMVCCQDPCGTKLELFHGPELAADPFRPGRPISGFRTGPLGMGHAVIFVENLQECLWFYTDVLGFRLSDYTTAPFKIMFLHTNRRHHSLALLEAPKRGLHHLMVELFSLDDVGQAYDIARVEEGRIGMTFGRHINDLVTGFYAYSPSGFMVEYGWGGLEVNPQTWTPQELTKGASLWGHELTWLHGDDLRAMREVRTRAAKAGLQAPVQVIDGNFARSSGICPWFDNAAANGHCAPFLKGASDV